MTIIQQTKINKCILQEQNEDSVKILVNFLKDQSLNFDLKILMLQDFFSRYRNLPDLSSYFYLSKVLKELIPGEIKNMIKDTMDDINISRKSADIGIVSIIPEELNAIKQVFNIEIDQIEDFNTNGLRFWESSLTQSDNKHKLTVVITMVGEASTIPCAVACSKMFSIYNIETCLLIGISAGVKGEVDLGDVIVSTMVLDYGGERLTPIGPQKRPIPYVPDEKITRDYAYFNKNKVWENYLPKIRKQLTSSDALKTEIIKNWTPNIDTGIILAGGKLFEDGSLPKMREKYDDKVRAAEMEGSGFARACREYDIQWLVFRGISDFGDKAGRQIRKKWKATSALTAAVAANNFLKYAYRRSEKDKF